LKYLKTNTSNEDGSDNTTLWSEEVIVCLKTTESHASWNVLKMWQHMFDGHTPPISSHSSNLIDLNACDAPPISLQNPTQTLFHQKDYVKFWNDITTIQEYYFHGEALEYSCWMTRTYGYEIVCLHWKKKMLVMNHDLSVVKMNNANINNLGEVRVLCDNICKV
jgi:hypothetical protein